MLNSKYKAIIFDWDGTLVDSTDWVVDAHNHVRSTFNLELWTKDDIFSSSSLSSRELYPKIYGDRAEEAMDILFAYVDEHNLESAIPYKGAANLLKLIQKRNMPQGVVSNKRHEPLNELVEHLNWQDYFSSVIGAGHCERDKPDAAPLRKAMLQISPNLQTSEVLYIGDSETDLQTAKNTGCDAILIQSDKPRPDLISQYTPIIACDNIQELTELLQNEDATKNSSC